MTRAEAQTRAALSTFPVLAAYPDIPWRSLFYGLFLAANELDERCDEGSGSRAVRFALGAPGNLSTLHVMRGVRGGRRFVRAAREVRDELQRTADDCLADLASIDAEVHP